MGIHGAPVGGGGGAEGGLGVLGGGQLEAKMRVPGTRDCTLGEGLVLLVRVSIVCKMADAGHMDYHLVCTRLCGCALRPWRLAAHGRVQLIATVGDERLLCWGGQTIHNWLQRPCVGVCDHGHVSVCWPTLASWVFLNSEPLTLPPHCCLELSVSPIQLAGCF